VDNNSFVTSFSTASERVLFLNFCFL